MRGTNSVFDTRWVRVVAYSVFGIVLFFGIWQGLSSVFAQMSPPTSTICAITNLCNTTAPPVTPPPVASAPSYTITKDIVNGDGSPSAQRVFRPGDTVHYKINVNKNTPPPPSPSTPLLKALTTDYLHALDIVNDNGQNVIWVVGDYLTVYRSPDNGITWENKSSIINPGPGDCRLTDVSNIHLYDIDVIDKSIAWAVGYGAGGCYAIIRTQDAGDTWQLLNIPSATLGADNAVFLPESISALSKDVAWVAGVGYTGTGHEIPKGGLYYIDLQNTITGWQNKTSAVNLPNITNKITVSASNNTTATVSYFDGSVRTGGNLIIKKTIDTGNTWAKTYSQTGLSYHENLNSHARSYHDLVMNDNGKGLAMNPYDFRNNVHILKSYDRSAWTQVTDLNNKDAVAGIDRIESNPNPVFWAAGSTLISSRWSSYLARSADNGNNWLENKVYAGFNFTDIKGVSPTEAWATGTSLDGFYNSNLSDQSCGGQNGNGNASVDDMKNAHQFISKIDTNLDYGHGLWKTGIKNFYACR